MALTIVVVLVLLAAIAMAAILAVYGSRRRREQQRIEAAISDQPAPADELPFLPDRAGGWHGPSCSGGFPAVDPAAPHTRVPAQRTGDHDRDGREPGRALAGRRLRRRGSSEPG
ncbi:hypothetical protein FHX44_112096 [Pseudonocardia hierapolitana]|uniref:Uncharacterized protein n=1 Tax=Pseudonocardia hierapolitana TaxID=1128676 RepID=A0A561SMX4_9PSEU|nr:hypothetical protein [Pseudonocardia hierapolitana]TWF76207.1 hypothetical protein FHX44_112096 [Pseudonocardia hierapolitana]